MGHFVIGSEDGAVKVWDIRDGSLLLTVTETGDEIGMIMCCCDDDVIVASSKRGIALISFKTGEILHRYIIFWPSAWTYLRSLNLTVRLCAFCKQGDQLQLQCIYLFIYLFIHLRPYEGLELFPPERLLKLYNIRTLSFWTQALFVEHIVSRQTVTLLYFNEKSSPLLSY